MKAPYLKKLALGATAGLGFGMAILAVGVAYATYSGLTASTAETLTKAKWNEMLQYTVPPGAVMAFNLTTCPTNWSEYTPAYGRFIRGIDKSGTAVDPDGQRAPGAIQNDSLQNHTHYIVGESGWQDNVVAEQDSNTDSPFAGAAGSSRGDAYIYVGYGKVGNFTSETRGRNVALLYCVKN